jgi:hypothetical protein
MKSILGLLRPRQPFVRPTSPNRSNRLTCGAHAGTASVLAAVFKHRTGNVPAKCRDVRLTLQKIDSIGNLRLALCLVPRAGAPGHTKPTFEGC